jgi:hypothetical protein
MSRRGAIDLVGRLVSRRPRYRFIVTVPQWGLHYSAIASRLAGIPMCCISDELMAEREATTAEEREWKKRERRAHQRCRWTIALSQERADFIREENGLGPGHRIFVVPNAEPGASRRLRSRYFHDVLGLRCEQRLLLHAGSLWWKEATALIESAQTWTNDWVVVIHGRFVRVHQRLERLSPRAVFPGRCCRPPCWATPSLRLRLDSRCMTSHESTTA